MKPLINIEEFLERFNYFKDGELRSIELVSPLKIVLSITAQDNAKEFDWISVRFEYSGTDDARLLDESKLSFVDMSDGITIIHVDDRFIFAIGQYDTLSNIKNSLCFISCSSIKYEEGLF